MTILRWRYEVYGYDKPTSNYPKLAEGHVVATSITKALKAVGDVGTIPDKAAAVRVWREEQT